MARRAAGGVTALLLGAALLMLWHASRPPARLIVPVQAVMVTVASQVEGEQQMDQTTMNFIMGAVVLIILGVALFEAGRARGEAGILKRLQEVNSSKPTLDAIEGLVKSVPGEWVEKIIGTIVHGMLAARPFLPVQAINDELRKTLTTVSDGLPNEPTPDEPPTNAVIDTLAKANSWTPPGKPVSGTPDATIYTVTTSGTPPSDQAPTPVSG